MPDMNSRIENIFNRVEAGRKKLFDGLRKYPDDLLNKKPAADAWSVMEVLQHLMASEEASLNYLRKKVQDTSRSHNAGWAGKRRFLLTKLIFITPIKFKAPENMNPQKGFMTLKEAEDKWHQLRAGIYDVISKLSDEELDKELWKHIISGKMNIYQMLEFFEFHIRRHQRQIKHTLAQVSK
jgi:uncharacterized damage-inducible protein DinB